MTIREILDRVKRRIDPAGDLGETLDEQGAASHSVSGETISWSEDPFAEYAGDIGSWLDANSVGHVHVQFL